MGMPRMMRLLFLGVVLLVVSKEVHSGSASTVYLDAKGHSILQNASTFRLITSEEHQADKVARRERIKQQRQRAREMIAKIPPSEDAERMSEEQLRKLGWFSSDTSPYNNGVLADPSQYYDKWAQAYRMLGAMIDCDHTNQGDHRSRDNNNNNNNQQGQCSRWMVWAAYVNPDYQGNEYSEYFGDSPTSSLDCHKSDTSWELLGVYRQDFYQFIEQISKHLWAIDSYEYVVARAGLLYIASSDCFQVGYTNGGTTIYAGIAPQPYGKFKMALYTDTYCLTPDTSLGMTPDDYGLGEGINLGDKDATNDDTYSWAYDWWYNSQEYTLTNLNSVYDDFRYCTSCVDYPTYQDGYYIGDDGMDDGDLINQCWKFYSHNSYTCEADCVAMAHAQGTILSVKYGDTTFGKTISGFYQERSSSTGDFKITDSPFQRLLANAALTGSFLLFIATFLAFAVARRSRYRENRSSKSRRLLDDDEPDAKSRRSSSRKSKSRDESDGLYRSSRSKSSAGRKSKANSKSRSGSKASPRKKRSRSYEPPKEADRSRSRSASRANDYF